MTVTSALLGPLAGLLAQLDPAAPKLPLSSTPTAPLGEQLAALKHSQSEITSRIAELEGNVGVHYTISRMDLFNGYIAVFVVAFAVTLLVTPLFRRLAIGWGVIDHPDETRKAHRFPIAYMGGVAVYCGMLAAIAFSYLAPLHGLIGFHSTKHAGDMNIPPPVPMSILAGMTIVMLIGLWDDVAKVTPLQKVGGQLIAAAFLAMNDVGVNVAKQVLSPIGVWVGNPDLIFLLPLPLEIPGLGSAVELNVVYWTGTFIIAVFVLGACNASNLIDGLDGLLSGVTAICAAGLLIVALGLAMYDDGKLDAARIIMCLALMGACLGFLPHNYNPATIFLGDSGSLLLGYTTIVIVLTLGDTGQTNLVLAGLIIYAVPIIDTSLAIVRRKMAGQRISAADDQHLHHILKRKMGVKWAVTTLYLMGGAFGLLGVLLTMERGRITYVLVLVLGAFIGVTAIKVARRKQFEEAAARLWARPPADPVADPPGSPAAAAPASTPTPASPATSHPA
ncbi:MAG: glycosyltransferase family 4 protein [bacterium]|jgi:UDP-GlcNAc:undecaprenyl-phosphate GlcNAc-1-phosphate transferase|nr:undecaprenyl/decaprenyl-phosphate alpha-N-acetylglucosaminyl 1-phosphate transferase [Phycisphaerales bacterium]MCE2652632.1 undecaprenyl/decaprenyl-phosphate alpha-N-acetylglucosaminyl 1-phosphate transferase [Planctomycetaceae bacterium]